MATDAVPSLATTLAGLTVTAAGGRTMTFDYVAWGQHLDARQWDALASGHSLLTIRRISNNAADSDIGSGAAQAKQMLEVHAYWADGDDLTGPNAFMKAVVEAIKAAVRAARKTTTPTWYVQVVNDFDLTGLIPGNQGTGTLKYEVAVVLLCNTVEFF